MPLIEQFLHIERKKYSLYWCRIITHRMLPDRHAGYCNHSPYTQPLWMWANTCVHMFVHDNCRRSEWRGPHVTHMRFLNDTITLVKRTFTYICIICTYIYLILYASVRACLTPERFRSANIERYEYTLINIRIYFYLHVLDTWKKNTIIVLFWWARAPRHPHHYKSCMLYADTRKQPINERTRDK